MKRVITVVVTYNRKDLLKEGLQALLSSDYENNRILIVDNASTDGTSEMLTEYIDNRKVFYFNTGKNMGGSYGFSFGSKKAVEMGCDYVWLMDDDCIVKKDSLSKLVLFAQKKKDEFGYLSSKVLWKDESMCYMNIPKSDIAKRIKDYDRDQRICIASFVSCFIKEKVIEEVGLSMADFFIWGDDWEYTYRISKKHPSYYVSDSVVVHKSKTNTGVNIVSAPDDILPRYRYAYRNESYFYHQAGLYGRLYLFFKVMLHTARVLFKHCDKKMTRLKYIYKYTFEGSHFRPHIDYVYSKGSDIKVLEYFGDPIVYGGQEIFMINMYRKMKDGNIHYVFGTPFFVQNKELPGLVQQRGDSIEKQQLRERGIIRKHNIIKGLKEILDKTRPDVIHIHSGSVYTLYECAKVAKKKKVKTVIVHSHLGGEMNFKYRLIKKKSDKNIMKYADYYLACSKLAAEWKFPKEILDHKQYILINNGIDLEKYRFNSEIRKSIRKQLGIDEEAFTLIHIGRFAPEKNHAFFLKLIPSLVERIPSFRFICIGAGDTKEEFRKELEELHVLDKFVFLQNINNVNEILFAADCFLLPSLHEGFPIALIEAQATGLPCIYSTLVTEEAKIEPDCLSCSLDDLDGWLNRIYEIEKEGRKPNRKEAVEIMKDRGFDSETSARLLEDIYRGAYSLCRTK